MGNEKIVGYLLSLLMGAFAYVTNPALVISLIVAVVLVLILLTVISLCDEDIFKYAAMLKEDMSEDVSNKTSMLRIMGFGIFLILVTVIYGLIG